MEDDDDSSDGALEYIKDDEFFNDIFEEKKETKKPETVPKTKQSRFGNNQNTKNENIEEKPTKSEQGQRENNNYKNKGYKNNNNFSIRYQIWMF